MELFQPSESDRCSPLPDISLTGLKLTNQVARWEEGKPASVASGVVSISARLVNRAHRSLVADQATIARPLGGFCTLLPSTRTRRAPWLTGSNNAESLTRAVMSPQFRIMAAALAMSLGQPLGVG
jgi:hypothetical protein